MKSPPSLFTQPPESVPTASLDCPSHFESTETGATPFEQPKFSSLPCSRTQSNPESSSSASASKQISDVIKDKAESTAENLRLQPSLLHRRSSIEHTVTPSAKRTWHQRDGEHSPESAESRGVGIDKRPKTALNSLAHSHLKPSDLGSQGRKRGASTSRQSRPAKLPKLSNGDLTVPEASDQVDFADVHSYRPVSPLFFSSHPAQQRPLAARFDSGEAGSRLLQATGMEDTGGSGNVRTVKMARGSVGHMSPPIAITQGASASRTPISRSRSGTSTTPTSNPKVLNANMGDDRDEHALGGGMQVLIQSGLIELLDQDDRPTFIVDVSYRSNFQPGPLWLTFLNNAAKAVVGLPEALRGRGTGETPAFSPTPSFPEFKAWATSFVSNNEIMDVTIPSYTFAGFMWKASAMRKRYRVCSGVLANASLVSLPPVTTPGGSMLNQATQALESFVYEEPLDYFSPGALAPVKEVSQENESAGSRNSPFEVQSTPERMLLKIAENDLRSAPRPVTVSEQVNGNNGRVSPLPSRLSSYNKARSPLGKTITDVVPSVTQTASSEAGAISPAAKTSEKADSAEVGFITPADVASSVLYFDWTRLPVSASLPRHIQFARGIDWNSTSLGPIESWSDHLRAMSCMIMASPHPAAMYWGEDNVAIYNEPYILLAGQKHPKLMGCKYAEAWPEIWHSVKNSFAQAKTTGQSTMKDDDRLFINRSGFLEETYFSWSIIPLVGEDGSVVGLYNPAFEKTRRKIAERRMLTLREVGEKTAAAREVKGFWGAVLNALEYNEYDTPFVLLYSVADEENSDGSSIHSNSILGARQATLEGTLPNLPPGHPAAPATIDLRNGTDGFAPIFREAMMTDKHILLETANGSLDPTLIDDMEWRGFNEKPRAAVVSPIHPTTGESIIGFLVMGVNPRRPYDDDYNLFVTLLTRQLATSMASVVLFEEEIRRGQRAAKLAALDRIELHQQLEARTQEAIESETKFTRMAEFAPVGIFIANKDGNITFTNSVFHSLTHLPKTKSGDNWMESVQDEDRHILQELWDDVVHKGLSKTAEIRFKGEWRGNNDATGEIWVLCSVFAEKYPGGGLKSIFGSLTDISQQKWAEEIQIKRTQEAIELKRQQSNFIDMTSHEMRNPLSAILQSADEIVGSLSEYKNSKDSSQVPLDLIESNIDAAQTISLCANHQTRIVSDVLTLSKLDSALLLVTPVDVQPKVIIQQAMKMFEGEMQTADIALNLQIDKSLDELNIDWIRLDPSRLLQVLINLMTNAIKFTTPEAKRSINISMTAYEKPPSCDRQTCVDYIPRRSPHSNSVNGPDWGDGGLIYLNFAVQDTGKGLTEDEKKLLFLRFSQASPKTHVRYGGSGLGLFISRELVELQGGEIGVSSEAGKGSTFAFYVQARRSNPPTDEGAEEAAKNLAANGGHTGILRKPSMTRSQKPAMSSGLSKLEPVADEAPAKPVSSDAQTGALNYLQILIVEDNLVNQKVLAKQLRKIGCHVEMANHGEEALTYLRKTKYWSENKDTQNQLELSVILMDLEMPVMDGLTCTRRIREMENDGRLLGHSPIIAVSANARSAHIDSALEAGMDDVVSKPFRIPELVPKMEQLVKKYRGSSQASD